MVLSTHSPHAYEVSSEAVGIVTFFFLPFLHIRSNYNSSTRERKGSYAL